MKKYPYCRPLHRINSGTPMTVGEIKKNMVQKIKLNVKEKIVSVIKKMTYVKKTIKKKKKIKKNQKNGVKNKKSINCKKPKGFSQNNIVNMVVKSFVNNL